MDNSKTANFPGGPADKMPYPPTPGPDLGPDEEAAVQSAQTFTPANRNVEEAWSPDHAKAQSGRWHTPLLLIVAAVVGAVFLLAIR
ncbi:MAG: hypothetical protein CTR53_10670 [Ferrovibrio sp.]|nr:MAG: hypothetical protein CTR53_10670 [Ferrovibrio sp.]